MATSGDGTMDADQARVKAYELALLTLSRIPTAFSVDQILQEAVKIEQWLMAANRPQSPAQQVNQVYASPNGGWMTVGGAPTVQPAPPATPNRPVKKADW